MYVFVYADNMYVSTYVCVHSCMHGCMDVGSMYVCSNNWLNFKRNTEATEYTD
jgi:hypothetical protein